eukprot:jgi/Botrbrau1/11119/Bobra.0219s0024.1
MLHAISRMVCSARTPYDTVVMEEGRIDPSKLWPRTIDLHSQAELCCSIHSAGEDMEWYGQARLAFSLHLHGRDVISLVHLRRYRECSGRRNRYHERLRMPRLVWETSGSRGRRRPVYQCVQLGTINNLVIMQRDPTPHSEEAFFCNTLVPMHYVQ